MPIQDPGDKVLQEDNNLLSASEVRNLIIGACVQHDSDNMSQLSNIDRHTYSSATQAHYRSAVYFNIAADPDTSLLSFDSFAQHCSEFLEPYHAPAFTPAGSNYITRRFQVREAYWPLFASGSVGRVTLDCPLGDSCYGV